MSSSLKVTINDKTARRLLEGFPKFVNQGMNRAYQGVGGEFGRKFTRERLRKGVLQVRRKGQTRPQPRGQPKLPKKMRLLGFKATIGRRERIEGKSLSIRTGNPIVTIRERGGVIRPKRGQFLFIRGDFKGRGAKARRESFQASQKGRRRQFGKPIVAKVKQIVVSPVLGFVRLWRAFAPQVVERLDKGLIDASKRAERSIRGK